MITIIINYKSQTHTYNYMYIFLFLEIRSWPLICCSDPFTFMRSRAARWPISDRANEMWINCFMDDGKNGVSQPLHHLERLTMPSDVYWWQNITRYLREKRQFVTGYTEIKAWEMVMLLIMLTNGWLFRNVSS